MRVAGLGEHVLIAAGDMSEEGGYRAAVRLLSRARGHRPSHGHLRGQRPDLRRRPVRGGRARRPGA